MLVKHLPTTQETWVQSLGQEDLLEKEMATHSSSLAWKIPDGGTWLGYSPWSRKESETTERLYSLIANFIAIFIPDQGTQQAHAPGNCPSLGGSGVVFLAMAQGQDH